MSVRGRAQHKRRLGQSFTRLCAGFTLASAGDGFAYGAVPLLAVAINPHPLAVSSVVAADTLPWLVLALPAGHFADRYKRWLVAALSNVIRAAAFLIATVLVATHHMSLGFLIVVVLINAASRAMYYSSFQAMVPSVARSNDLERANGVLSATEMGAEHIAGPILGSSLFAISSALPFLADSIALVSSCFPFARLRSKISAPPRSSDPSSDSIWEGIRLLLADARLRILLILITSLALLQGMESGVLVLLATKRWGVSEGAYGLFLAGVAIGNIVGSLIAEGQAKRFGSARAIIGFAIVSGTGYLLMASAHSWVLAGPAFALTGVAVVVISVIGLSLRQRITPDHLMGRVGGAWRGIVWGAAPLGALVAGGVASLWGLKVPLVLAGSLQILVAFVLARPLLRIIQDDRIRKNSAERRRHAPGNGSLATEAAPFTSLDPQ